MSSPSDDVDLADSKRQRATRQATYEPEMRDIHNKDNEYENYEDRTHNPDDIALRTESQLRSHEEASQSQASQSQESQSDELQPPLQIPRLEVVQLPPLAPLIVKSVYKYGKPANVNVYPKFDEFHNKLSTIVNLTYKLKKETLYKFYLQYAKSEASRVASSLLTESQDESTYSKKLESIMLDWLRSNFDNINPYVRLELQDAKDLGAQIIAIFSQEIERQKENLSHGLPPAPPSGLPPHGKPPVSPSSSSGSPSGSSSSSSSSYSKPIYSTTSDHKLVFLNFPLTLIGIGSGEFVAMSYNMSFLSDLGPRIPKGSEAVFLSTIKGTDRRVYWKNAVQLVQCFIKDHEPDIMFFQEMNDRDSITTTNPNFVSLEDGTFKGGYQALLEAIQDIGTVYTTSPNQVALPTNSYYKYGSLAIKGETYQYLAYSVAKGPPYVYPTVLTIWKIERLGELHQFYGNDLGKASPHYDLTYMEKLYNGDTFHHGRNFSCVRTTKGANLVNIHGPNAPSTANPKLKGAIELYLQQSYATFSSIWENNATVIGGDTNDANNMVPMINFNGEDYSHLNPPPISCCFETMANTLLPLNYPYSGDKIYVANPTNWIQLYEESYCPALRTTASGKNKRYRSLKKKKKVSKVSKVSKVRKVSKVSKVSNKVKQNLYNNKKSVRKPRIQANKNIRTTYKR